jgi:hypothetical protein
MTGFKYIMFYPEKESRNIFPYMNKREKKKIGKTFLFFFQRKNNKRKAEIFFPT